MITSLPIDTTSALGDFSAANDVAGAVVSFIGKVRGDGVASLDLEHHPTFSAKVIAAIGADARARFAIADCLGRQSRHEDVGPLQRDAAAALDRVDRQRRDACVVQVRFQFRRPAM